MPNTSLSLLIFVYSCIINGAVFFIRIFVGRLPIAQSWDLDKRNDIPLVKKGVSHNHVEWLHAASLGESKLLIKFIGILRKKHPDYTFLLTATTRNGVAFLKSHDASDIAGIGVLPFDTSHRMRKLLSTFHVARVWIMETELWPALMYTCLKAQIPLGLVNARIEEKSLKSYSRLRFLLSSLFSYPTIVLAQNQVYADRFSLLGISRSSIHIVGNLKSAETIAPLPLAERESKRTSMFLDKKDICITLGCFHDDEMPMLTTLIDTFESLNISTRIIIVPRHLRETPGIVRELAPRKVLICKDTKTCEPWDICIIDKIGILESMYAISDFAIIGGTFDAVGGHNMWDAAQFGIPLIVGPDVHTQLESVKTLLEANVAFKVQNGAEAAQTIGNLLTIHKAQYQKSQILFMQQINSKNNSIETILP